jgi:hypothetical protein
MNRMSTSRNQRRRSTSEDKNDPLVHKFKVGQTVRFKPNLREAIIPDQDYRIVANLPVRDDSPQYRIRNSGERHERVTTQEQLMAANEKEADPAGNLMDETFGKG